MAYEFQTVPNLAPESSSTTSTSSGTTKSSFDWNTAIPSFANLAGGVLGIFGNKNTQPATQIVAVEDTSKKSNKLIIGLVIGFILLVIALYFIFKNKK